MESGGKTGDLGAEISYFMGKIHANIALMYLIEHT